ncbi:DUF4184 family protein [Pontibacter sp. HSC-36F09]|uniref:DUF4184 family protein n=1 Tax=Pontibacter sp. HSC-36F09 TaxID=2910966 RepID=UPI00209FB902|nr:DUF4184 family protein [Pontibacter sp. HSC-36F09]MCP2042239.1 multidrug transporter EmrE-like cation transporter [Pontibacter sp. HSC-36F09]
MPFTAAHPAAILPFLKHSRWFSATGLITGSIAPDFQYFLLLPLFKHSGHSLEGLLYFNLPVALGIATVFHLIVRRPAIAHLPNWLKSRALAIPEPDWLHYLKERWFVFAMSAILGAATHIFWDSFTHESGYFVQKWPVLTGMVNVMGFEIMLCRIVQHSSTLVGSLLILLYTWRQPTVAILDKMSLQQKIVFWSGIGIAGIAFMGYALYASTFMRSPMGIVVSFLTGSMMATIAVSIALKLGWLRKRN